MAGHSKWANIKHKKDKADKKKGKVFSRIAKEIISAVKVGGLDPKSNPRLRLSLQKARAANMPNDNIDRNIKKATADDQSDYVEVTYELYGHGGVGIIVEAMTDNKNRMASEIRIATNKRGGSLATSGSVAFNFDRRGVIQIPKEGLLEDALFAMATEAGALDFEDVGDVYILTTEPQELYQVKEVVEATGFHVEEASLEMIPKTSVDCDPKVAQANQGLIDWLEDIDDVDAVYHNMQSAAQ